jgi:phosphotriesterase-related protein
LNQKRLRETTQWVKSGRRDFIKHGALATAGLFAAGCVPSAGERDTKPRPTSGETSAPKLITTLGPKRADELGMILPHEHVFVDLRTWDKPGYGKADPADVVKLMGPELEKARAAGVTALVECSPEGVGRRVDILKAVSLAADFPLVVPTGIYREPWIPPWAHEASEDALYGWMLGELQDAVQDTGVQAAWIKLSVGDNGITESERKILRAAVRAAAVVNAVIGSHTRRGNVVHEQLDIIEQAGYTAQRFIWIHAQNDPDLNLEIAQRGAWIEYDAIGNPQRDAFFIERIQTMLDAGFAGQLLLSHDRGWYDPAKPGGGLPKPFTYISSHFLPRLSEAGIDEAAIRQLTHTNPFQAFAR